ncbi:MAG TPA: dephospho-CoA kinase [Polyangia bacterium]|nr:dephospho-CoA kinase [Polyangia bacterium]
MTRGFPASLRVFGLTGGIGTGKSTVAEMFAARGVPVVDADQLAREVVAPGTPGHADIAAAWPETIDASGALDRKRLGALVFADPAARARLEAILHPRISEAAATRLTALAAAGQTLALYEAALLVETGRHRDFDGLIVVTASPETQIARALSRGGLTRADAEARIRAQLPAAEKVRLATHLIDNDGPLAETKAQVDRLLVQLRRSD